MRVSQCRQQPPASAIVLAMQVLIVVVGIIALWTLWGYLSSNVEQAVYTVITHADGYELRAYPERIVAQTTIDGSYDAALNEGFSIVAGYIFGGNVKKEPIAMTAPVTSQPASEKIAMTAPVTVGTEGSQRVVAFVMPAAYTLESLPQPTDPRVRLVKEPPRKMAVIRFSWSRGGERVRKMEAQLLASLKKDGIEVIGAPVFAGYNAPGTPPWMNRHEVMVEVR